MAHRLDPLLKPRSIAVLGASERLGSVGRRTIENLLLGGYAGDLFALNPGYQSVLGVPCFASLDQLPKPVEHVVFAIGDQHLETALEAVISHGARAATIMSQLLLAEDSDPPLKQRAAARIAESGLLVCGANAMGFYNFSDGVWACGFDTRENHRSDGRVTLISQSGAGMSGIVDCEQRLDFNLAVSTGQEISVRMHDYMDFAIESLDTRAIGLFMETVRDPKAVLEVLDKAARRRIPVVAIKVGRSRLSAELAQSHSGALAGEDSAYEALFDHYGVQRVNDMHELATALMMFGQPHTVAGGGLVAIHDSGGERQLLVDLAEQMAVPLAALSTATVARLAQRLDPGLPAVNPLDAWGAGGPGGHSIMQDCLAAMMADPDCALGAVVHDRAPDGRLYPEYAGYLRAGHAASDKPAFLVSNHPGSGSDPLAVELTREGFPVLDGLRPFLAGVKALLGYRDFLARPLERPRAADAAALARAHRLLKASVPDESATLGMLGGFGLPANPAVIVQSARGAQAAASRLGYPVALKTAQPGIAHKSEVGGVRLGLGDAAAVASAWSDLAARLGPRVLVAPMVRPGGLEMALGMVQDQQFGPLVMLGLGGTRLEALADVVFAIPPFGEAAAARHLQRLGQHAQLSIESAECGTAGLAAFCRVAARFSEMASALADSIREMDLNPVIVHADGCTVVDAWVVGNQSCSDEIPTRCTA